MKKWLLAGGAVVIAAGAGAAYVANVFPSAIAPIEAIDTASFSEEQLEKGELLAYLGDCSSCHKGSDGKSLSGGFGLPTPFGTIYATNITPDRETGIGTWSLDAFKRAMREGIRQDGAHLYPAFPYDHFDGTTDEDLAALYAHLMTQPAVNAPNKANEMPFPFGLRPILAGWKFLFHSPKTWTPNPEFNEEENRGKYIAETLGHCSSCHAPRNALGAVQWDKGLAGGEAEGWLVPPLGEHSVTPVAWDEDSYADYLFEGWSEHHAIGAGPMTEVVDNLYEAADLSEDDVYAIAVWLAKITPKVDDATRDAQIEAVLARDLPADFNGKVDGANVTPAIARGAEVFRDNCLKCHKERTSENQPISLGATFAVNAHLPTNLLNAVIQGVRAPAGSPQRKMEPVQLSDEDLAAVTEFVRFQFTDKAPWSDVAGAVKTARAHAAH